MFTSVLTRKYFPSLNFNKSLSNYLSSLKRLAKIKDKDMDAQYVLNSVSISAIKLLIRIFTLLIPYFIVYAFSILLVQAPNLIAFIISTIVYLPLLRLK